MFIGLCFGKIYPTNRGYFKNDKGISCWYKTVYLGDTCKYFGYPTDVYTHTFEKLNMTNNNISKMMIANVVTKLYKGTEYRSDTKFNTDPQEWTKAKDFQKQGYCINSNYPAAVVWIDFEYSSDKKYITKVYHGLGM